MADSYREFFAASAGASAAFIGLLFVALSFIDAGKVDERTRAWRRVLASAAFSQLVDVFFVSMAGLLPDPHNLALVGVVMAGLGLVVQARLLPRALARDRTGRRAPSVLGMVAVAAYVLQLVCGIALLNNPDSGMWMGYFVLSLTILYAGALGRAWEITGLKEH